MKYICKNNLIFAILVIVLGVFCWVLMRREGFTGESLYDLMEKEAEISHDEYIKAIRNTDIIQSNPWIMIETVNKNATIHPRGVLDRLTGQQSDKLSWHPRAYYDYSDVVYTGLPL